MFLDFRRIFLVLYFADAALSFCIQGQLCHGTVRARDTATLVRGADDINLGGSALSQATFSALARSSGPNIIRRAPIGQIIRGRKIGEGSYGTVYECQYQGQRRALKVATNGADMGQEVLMLDKANPQNQSPNIVAMVVGVNQYMVLELCDGDLFTEIESRYYYGNVRRIKTDFLQILAGVRQMHMRGVYHRDLKPGNILVKGGVMKITDFGSASDSMDATHVVSTLPYAPPEFTTGNGHSEDFDIWALGVILIEMVFIARGWDDPREPNCLAVRSNPRALQTLFPSMSEECYQILKHIFYLRDVRINGLIRAVGDIHSFYQSRTQGYYRRGLPNLHPVPIRRDKSQEMGCSGGKGCPARPKAIGPPKWVTPGHNGPVPVIVNAPVGS